MHKEDSLSVTSANIHDLGSALRTLRGALARRILFAVVVLAAARTAAAGPYSPAPPAGSDAVSASDPAIVEWASGYQDYELGSPANPSYENPSESLGAFKNSVADVTNLGEGGQITYTFAEPIVAGTSGFDFAVFGNGFESTYEKLAFVYVSANGVNWYEMPNYDLTPGPVGTYGTTDPTNIYGLAGKYQLGYGVGYNLSEVGLASASYVKIVDVVGNGSTFDSAGDPIYSPYPNDLGFNVDAIGVMSAAPEPGTLVLLSVGLVLL
ncbi:MAG TPA: hypothetical protein VMF30_19405, partial [Pirellulales bacterium]|nr:hypothetical protein [Pirellulales bacterium]